jgi:hypothetical protein
VLRIDPEGRLEPGPEPSPDHKINTPTSRSKPRPMTMTSPTLNATRRAESTHQILPVALYPRLPHPSRLNSSFYPQKPSSSPRPGLVKVGAIRPAYFLGPTHSHIRADQASCPSTPSVNHMAKPKKTATCNPVSDPVVVEHRVQTQLGSTGKEIRQPMELQV